MIGQCHLLTIIGFQGKDEKRFATNITNRSFILKKKTIGIRLDQGTLRMLNV